jgi:hypothetical protein
LRLFRRLRQSQNTARAGDKPPEFHAAHRVSFSPPSLGVAVRPDLSEVVHALAGDGHLAARVSEEVEVGPERAGPDDTSPMRTVSYSSTWTFVTAAARFALSIVRRSRSCTLRGCP